MKVKHFKSGASRSDGNKYDYEGFTSALVKRRFAQFMHRNRRMPDGSLRDGDNWQKGIPRASYMKSLIRHVEQLHYQWDRGAKLSQTTICAIRFNVDGLLHEILVGRHAR